MKTRENLSAKRKRS